MNDKFFELKQEKQDRIINAALTVFAQSSYRHASTDDIVKKAGISKGLLFHYFTSKLGLYEFLFDYSARFMLLEFSREVERSETDFFALAGQVERARMQVMRIYPYMQQFLNMALREESAEAAERTQQKRGEYQERMRAYSLQADYSVFAGIGSAERMVALMRYVIDGITADMSKQHDFTPEKLYREICEYIAMMQRMMRRV